MQILKKLKFYPLKIDRIKRETPSAVSISFEVPADLKETFNYKAGQYLSFKIDFEGEEIRRDYSICSDPASGELMVAVKAVENGKFSNFANSELKVGDVLYVAAPQGKFILEPNNELKRTIVAFAAGSGITPIMGIIKTLLKEEPKSDFLLIYGNKSVEETIFFEELMQLKTHFTDRLTIQFVFSKKPEDDALFGRIESSVVNFVLNKLDDLSVVDAFYLCGPGGMIDEVSKSLELKGISKERIKFELFTPKEAKGETAKSAEGFTKVEVLVDDEEAEFTMPRDKTILEVALEEGIDAPYSCQGGICSSCIARITEGQVHMRQNNILTDGELEEGLILTCQSQPLTDVVKINYDDV